ncbi:MAG: exodeoxyribonuclease VII large subunit, partial [Porphyrobacter sp.]|nr:exodeoxyribonuclease VII large subunit [Porphyrobacter sp.]
VARLPRPQALAAAPQQRLDDLAERLRRGLADRAVRARERLAAEPARLSLALLRQQVIAARGALAATRLRPALLERAWAERRERLAALDRVRRQLDPEAPLQRGYALVSAPGHAVIASRALAERQDALTLKFADGALAVVPAGGEAAPAPRKPPAKGGRTPGYDQPKLL